MNACMFRPLVEACVGSKGIRRSVCRSLLILFDMSRRAERGETDLSRPLERRSRPYDEEGRRYALGGFL